MNGFFAGGDLSPNTIELARQKSDRIGGYVDLTSSNPTSQNLLFPSHILENAAKGYWEERRYHPDPRGAQPALRAIQSYYSRRSPALKLELNQIYLTASTSEAYSHLFALLTNPGDNILAPRITYPLFEYLAEIHRVELRPYELDESQNWRIDQSSVQDQADDRTRAILVVSPHNPTGMVVREPLVVFNKLDLPIICDEVFVEFCYKAAYVPPLATLHPDLKIFHLNGISKLFALPDLKLGWIALSKPANLEFGDRLELLNDTFLGASSLIQWMLPTLFDKGWDFVSEMRRKINENLDLALARFSVSPNLKAAAPDGGYYLFPKVRGWQDEEALVLYLLEEGGVLVHPGYYYGYDYSRKHGAHIMISCLTEKSKLIEGIERLERALA